MLNEADYEALKETRNTLANNKPTAFRFSLTVDEIVEALDRAGITGLIHECAPHER